MPPPPPAMPPEEAEASSARRTWELYSATSCGAAALPPPPPPAPPVPASSRAKASYCDRLDDKSACDSYSDLARRYEALDPPASCALGAIGGMLLGLFIYDDFQRKIHVLPGTEIPCKVKRAGVCCVCAAYLVLGCRWPRETLPRK